VDISDGGDSAGGADPQGELRVAQLLTWDGPRVELVGREVGLDRVVRWALPTDLLDPSPYLRGGEVVLTSGISMRDAASQEAFARAVCAARPAAVGFALGVVSHTVPAALTRAVNACDVAMLSVPPAVAFVEITRRIAAEQQSRATQERARAEVGALMDMVRRGHASPIVLREHIDGTLGEAASMWVLAARGPLPDPDGAAVRGTTGGLSISLVATGLGAGPDRAGWHGPIGWSGPVSIAGLPGALREATAAAALASRVGEPRGPRDLATWEGLIERLTPDQLAPFRDHVLAPLRAYDARHRTHLLETAERICDGAATLQAAADDLFVHINTVRKRVARIEALTGINPLEPRGRAAFLVALAARRD